MNAQRRLGCLTVVTSTSYGMLNVWVDVLCRVGEDVLDGCLAQVCQEVFAEFDATVDGLVAAETALS
jgi:hypothetical protein